MYPTTVSTAIQSGNRPGFEVQTSRSSGRFIVFSPAFCCHSFGIARTISRRQPAVSRKSPSPYKCSFCSDRLEQLKFRGWRVILLVLPMRDFRCPHCFAVFSKPVSWIGRCLPSISVPKIEGVSKRVRRVNRAASNTSDTLLKRCLKFLSRLGKRVTNAEEFLGGLFRQLLTWLNPEKWKKRRRHSETSESSGRRGSEQHRSSRDHETSKPGDDFPQSPS